MTKQTLDDLACFGGEPAFDENLYVGRPNIGDRDVLMRRIEQMLDRRFLTNNGPFVQEFEAHIAEYIGVKHCVAMCNGTIALEIAIRAANLSGEVIVPSFTFVATAHALQWQQITPVFCDVDPKTHNIDPERIEELITPKTTAIIATHLWGNPCDVEALEEIARRHNLRLMFDAAHAFGCSHKGRMIGGFGDGEVYSFHATKFINAFEAGAFVTNDDELAEKARLMRNFGFAGYDHVIHVGTNGKLNEACAAMGLTSLEAMPQIVEANQRNYEQYKQRIAQMPGLSLFEYDTRERHNFQYIVLEVDEQVVGLSRDQITDLLHAEHIIARRYFKPGCHRMEPYRSNSPKSSLWLPQTEALTERVFALPNGTTIDAPIIDDIMDTLAFISQHGHAIRERL